MLKIKTQINQKLLKNFSNEAFPDITIITSQSRYNLTLAYLSIDSQYFNNLQPTIQQVNLSYLPEKPLVQILRSLYGDQLIANSVNQLELLFKVIQELQIDQYVESIIKEIKNNKDLMENLQILQFCMKNNLMVQEIKKIHIQNNLRALQSNRNFLQLNKISLPNLIPLLLQYNDYAQQNGATVINNILQNYFNRNNIRPVDFFQREEDVDVLLGIWEQFHHILHIQRKPAYKTQPQRQPMHSFTQPEQRLIDTTILGTIKSPFGVSTKSKQDMIKLSIKDARIAQLLHQIQQQNKIIDKLKKQLYSLNNQKIKSTKRFSSNPIQTAEEDQEISLVDNKIVKKDLFLKNVRSQFTYEPETKPDGRGEVKTPNRFGTSSKVYRFDY